VLKLNLTGKNFYYKLRLYAYNFDRLVYVLSYYMDVSILASRKFKGGFDCP
jgi:hypothetical protein